MMSSGTPSLMILSDEQKFNGENLLNWTVNMIQLLGVKGLLGYVEGTIPKPTQLALLSRTRHLYMPRNPVLTNGFFVTSSPGGTLPLIAQTSQALG
jgi:hypothetical protein